MSRFKEAAGRRVIARDSAEEIGTIHRFLVDRSGHVRAVTIGDLPIPAASIIGNPLAAGVGEALPDPPIVLDWSAIVGFGGDAVVAPSADALRAPASDDERAAVRGSMELVGRPLLTDGGDLLGKVDDVEFDDRSGALISLRVGDRDLPLTRIVAIGPFAVIIAAPG